MTNNKISISVTEGEANLLIASLYRLEHEALQRNNHITTNQCQLLAEKLALQLKHKVLE